MHFIQTAAMHSHLVKTMHLRIGIAWIESATTEEYLL